MPTPHRPELNALFHKSPEEAIQYLESKGFKIEWDWHQTLDDAHSRAFTVAKVAKLDVLQDIRSSLITALEKGQSFKKWQSEITPILQQKGWWGKKTVINPAGQEQEVQLGSPRRLRTIYHTNMRSAFSAGRYKAMLEATQTRPYWEYRHITMVNYREEHKSWNGVILRADDPFWTVAYPPSKFGCNCRVIARSAREVEGKEILSSDGYQTQYSEKIGVDSFTGADVYATRQRFDIPTKDGVISFSPAAGFNNSPATSYAMDQVLVQRASKYFPSDEGLRFANNVITSPVRQRAHQAFIDNTLSFGEAQGKRNTVGLPLSQDVLRINTAKQIQLDSPIILMKDDFVLDPFAPTQAELIALPLALTQASEVYWHEGLKQLVYKVSLLNEQRYIFVAEDMGLLHVVRSASLNEIQMSDLQVIR